ncbi:MAG: DegT/DnrJ/EryC1/StrS family aminotransferase, partial [Pseudonocardiaceae bacterium]
VITTGGEGGFVLTADDEHADRIRRLRSHGEGPDGGRYLWSHEVGYNYRLTAMQAAIGLSQFKRLDELVDARRANAAHLTRRLDGVPGLELPVEPPGTTHAYWRYVVRSVSRPAERLMDELRAEGVPVMMRYPYPVHRQPAFAAYPRSCPVAERLSAELLTIPAHPALRPEHLDAIADRIIAVLDR